MDIPKLFEIATTFITEYLSVFVATLTNPEARFRPVTGAIEQVPQGIVTAANRGIGFGPSISPKLVGFMLMSVLIGTSLQSRALGTDLSDLFNQNAIVTLVLWVVFASCVYYGCRVVGSAGSYIDTISVGVQLLAVVYVVASLALFVFVLSIPLLDKDISGVVDVSLLKARPILVYYTVQWVLLALYLPRALKSVHNLDWRQLVVAYSIPTIFVLLISNITMDGSGLAQRGAVLAECMLGAGTICP